MVMDMGGTDVFVAEIRRNQTSDIAGQRYVTARRLRAGPRARPPAG